MHSRPARRERPATPPRFALLPLAALAGAAALLASCGGTDSDTTVSGFAAKGTLKFATVTAYQVGTTGTIGTAPVGQPTTTDADGNYTYALPTSGQYVLKVTSNANTVHADELLGDQKLSPDFVLSTYVQTDGAATVTASITPYSHMIVTAASKATGGISPATIATAKTPVTDLVGFDPTTLAKNDGSTANARSLKLLLASVAQMAQDGALGCASAADKTTCVVNAMADAASPTGAAPADKAGNDVGAAIARAAGIVAWRKPELAGETPAVVAKFRKSAVKLLFVGNSYTFARVAPALQYNTANVTDMTAAFNDVDATGTNSFPITGQPPNPCGNLANGCFEPHPWGGVPGIFKKLADEVGLPYDVSLSTRNAATLRGQFLNTANAAWDLRGNVAKQKWDAVILQAQSDEPLPSAKSKNGNPAQFKTYAVKLADYVQVGTGGTTTETALFGDLGITCTAPLTATPPGPGLSATSCNQSRTIPANTNANAKALVYLQQTWARPDMVEAHKCTTPDKTTLDGAPIPDATCSSNSNGTGGNNTVYYTTRSTTTANMRDMTDDMRASFDSVMAASKRFTGIIPVGEAFQLALERGVAKNTRFYDPATGLFDTSGSLIDLWWLDRTHPSKYGAYLSALTNFAVVTGVDPVVFGANEQAAKDLGIAPDVAVALQKLASDAAKKK